MGRGSCSIYREVRQAGKSNLDILLRYHCKTGRFNHRIWHSLQLLSYNITFYFAFPLFNTTLAIQYLIIAADYVIIDKFQL